VDTQQIILASLIGTTAMTLFMYGMTFLTDRVMKVVKILGTMLTFQTTADGHLSDNPVAIGIGLIAHYLIGIAFGFCYYELWHQGIGEPTIIFGVVAGFISGLIGMLIWRIFFALHPKPPMTVPLQSYLFTLLAAHIVFGVTVVLTYQKLQPF
jgi:riboflavin transporter FmnP